MWIWLMDIVTSNLTEFPARHDQLTSLHYLVSLLPVPNRDTLFALLNFLSTVDAHSTDVLEENNEMVSYKSKQINFYRLRN